MRIRMAMVVIVTASIVAAAHAPAADQPAGTGAPASHAILLDRLGDYHRPITTRSPEAQRWFDQGIRLVYAFNHDEAQRSFEEAARIDPTCAICDWGAALCLGPNINLPALPDRAKAAFAFVTRAQSLAGGASEVERALIGALAKRYADPPPTDPAAQRALDTAYADAMREVAKRFPDDLDVQTLFAESMMDLRPWDLWTNDGREQPGTAEILATLERVLAGDPSHPGANHYYIHAVEASPHPEKGLDAAGRLPSLIPGAGHIVHMPAHIYERVGRYEDASEANRRAIEVDKAYVAQAHPEGFYAMYVAHNYQFLCESAMMEGRRAEAVAAAREMVRQVPADMLRQMPGFDLVLTLPCAALARFGMWDQVLTEPAPPPDFPFANAICHYARGVALAAQGRIDDALREEESVTATRDATAADATEGLSLARPQLDIAAKVLAARIASAQGKLDPAIESLREAVSEQDSLHYDEPPDWYYPVRQTLGAALLRAGRAAEAEAVYRQDLARNPENGWSLYGLARSLRAQGKQEEATLVDQRFREAWRYADTDLAGLP